MPFGGHTATDRIFHTLTVQPQLMGGSWALGGFSADNGTSNRFSSPHDLLLLQSELLTRRAAGRRHPVGCGNTAAVRLCPAGRRVLTCWAPPAPRLLLLLLSAARASPGGPCMSAPLLPTAAGSDPRVMCAAGLLEAMSSCEARQPAIRGAQQAQRRPFAGLGAPGTLRRTLL